MLTLQDAVDDLYRIAIKEGKRQSPARLAILAKFVGEQLEARGLSGTQSEVRLRAWSRVKDWDAVLIVGGRVRVAVSCKSILRNLPGTVPNRGDDLTGEAADLQLRYPETVIGYITIMDESEDMPAGSRGKWIRTFEERLASMAIRTPPIWQGGLIEAGAVVRVDFSKGPALRSPPNVLDAFFDKLVAEHSLRSSASFVPRGKKELKPPVTGNPTLAPPTSEEPDEPPAPPRSGSRKSK